jgi:SAM-dependent methyltransferase
MMKSNFWDDMIRKIGIREDLVLIPGAPSLVNKYMDFLQKKALIPWLSLPEKGLALDVGTGIGRWASILSEGACFVIGIDISKEMVKIARQRVMKNNVDFIVSAAYALPLRSKSVDLSLSCTCLQHIIEEDEQEESLHEIARVTKQKILILELMSKTKKKKLFHYPMLITPKLKYISTLTKSGAKTVRDFGVDFLPFVKLIEDFRNFLLTILNVNVTSYGGSFTQRLLRSAYRTISALALLFSLPFNKLLNNPPSNVSMHVLLVANIK